MPPGDLKKLATICKKVKPVHAGLSESARRSPAPFNDVNIVRTFLRLPDRIVAAVEKIESPTRAEANRVAAALWIKSHLHPKRFLYAWPGRSSPPGTPRPR